MYIWIGVQVLVVEAQKRCQPSFFGGLGSELTRMSFAIRRSTSSSSSGSGSPRRAVSSWRMRASCARCSARSFRDTPLGHGMGHLLFLCAGSVLLVSLTIAPDHAIPEVLVGVEALPFPGVLQRVDAVLADMEGALSARWPRAFAARAPGGTAAAGLLIFFKIARSAVEAMRQVLLQARGEFVPVFRFPRIESLTHKEVIDA